MFHGHFLDIRRLKRKHDFCEDGRVIRLFMRRGTISHVISAICFSIPIMMFVISIQAENEIFENFFWIAAAYAIVIVGMNILTRHEIRVFQRSRSVLYASIVVSILVSAALACGKPESRDIAAIVLNNKIVPVSERAAFVVEKANNAYGHIQKAGNLLPWHPFDAGTEVKMAYAESKHAYDVVFNSNMIEDMKSVYNHPYWITNEMRELVYEKKLMTSESEISYIKFVSYVIQFYDIFFEYTMPKIASFGGNIYLWIRNFVGYFAILMILLASLSPLLLQHDDVFRQYALNDRTVFHDVGYYSLLALPSFLIYLVIFSIHVDNVEAMEVIQMLFNYVFVFG